MMAAYQAAYTLTGPVAFIRKETPARLPGPPKKKRHRRGALFLMSFSFPLKSAPK